jgi:alpha-D-ribose 1-methylphosphonate 5-triphosphate synthase subunit PhnG
MANDNPTNPNDPIVRRKNTMVVLADAGAAEIARGLDSVRASVGGLPGHDDLRSAESGLVMIQGRIGGDGAPFNMGEATVSRAAVRLHSGETGFGYVLGRDREKARLVALCDALVQTERYRDSVEREVVTPIRCRLDAERKRRAEEIAATKVEFFTLVRGED